MRSAIRAVEPEIPVDGVATLEQQIADALAKRRFQLFLVSSFALLAVALTAIGMFALMRNALLMRGREVGIRLALGAEPDDVVRLFAREGIALVAAGLGIGLAISAAALRFLESMVVRTGPNDPAAVTAAVLLILAVTGLSCYLPSRRAARVDPAVVLKSE